MRIADGNERTKRKEDAARRVKIAALHGNW